RPCPRAGRDRAADHDRHGGRRVRDPDQPRRSRDGTARTDLHVGRPARAWFRRPYLGGDHRPARLPADNERDRRGAQKAVRTEMVNMDTQQADLAEKQLVEDQGETKFVTRDVHVYYGEKEAIKGVDLDIYSNEVTALIGPSG